MVSSNIVTCLHIKVVVFKSAMKMGPKKIRITTNKTNYRLAYSDYYQLNTRKYISNNLSFNLNIKNNNGNQYSTIDINKKIWLLWYAK